MPHRALETIILAGVLGNARGAPCKCKFQGQDLPSDVYTNFPSNDPGKYKPANNASIAKYGTMCAAWDQMPGTPSFASCSGTNNNYAGGQNWCQKPWCYVEADAPNSCTGATATGLFQGSAKAAYYSYDVCGASSASTYDPSSEGDYKTHKTSCPCKYQGGYLPSTDLSTYPTGHPGKYSNYANIALYGTSCAAWDQSPNTPWASSCPRGAGWCSYQKNWCQIPWCYVDSSCSSKVATSTFQGSTNIAYYSYDTCLSSPDCYTNRSTGKRTGLPSSCPFDKNDNNWYTAKVCSAWTDEDQCMCKFQGKDLPSSVYTNFPTSDPGLYKPASYVNVAKYGTMCAAWDQMPGTPGFADCSGTKNNYGVTTGGQNWCQIPWCYVPSDCAGAVATGKFQGTTEATHYSYAACGAAPDCYNQPTLSNCPYDPSGEQDYKTHKASCPCKYAGTVLPDSLLYGYPDSNPGKYKNLPNIQLYGTACAAWDQSPNTPFISSCPSGADWCSYGKNWCQIPWCYVESTCSSRVASTLFKGSTTNYYSYDTCLSSPDCSSNSGVANRNKLPSSCPFDKNDNKWYTAKVCSSYTAVEPISANTAAGMAISGAGVMVAAAACAA